MRKFLSVALIFLSLGIKANAQKIDIDGARGKFGKISVTPSDRTVSVSGGKIVIAPKKENAVYTISGYFSGQIVSKTKNTEIRLNGAFIENTAGLPAIFCEAKTEISTAQGTENYVVSSGNGEKKSAAIQSKKNLVLGGSGALHVSGSVCHGIKADDVKIKGSGKFLIQGTERGSAISCENFIVEKGKNFACHLLNSKNGVKADETILVQSGNFFLESLGTAFKTDKKKDDPKKPHSITLSGGTFRAAGVQNFQSTEKGAYKADGAKIEGM